MYRLCWLTAFSIYTVSRAGVKAEGLACLPSWNRRYPKDLPGALFNGFSRYCVIRNGNQGREEARLRRKAERLRGEVVGEDVARSENLKVGHETIQLI